MKKVTNMKTNHEEFMEELYITCNECGYNNLKRRFENYGTCLRCGKILDKKVHFKAELGRLARRTCRSRTRKASRSLLYF